MGTSTNLEQDRDNAANRAALCRAHGDYEGAVYWEDEAARLCDRIVLLQNRAKWAALADNRHE